MWLVPLSPHADERGAFQETFRQSWFPGRPPMVQGNRSCSRAGVLRGLHFHRLQSDFWYVAQGSAFVVLVDLRIGSPAHLGVATLEMAEAELGLYIPPGVVHGYYSLTETTVSYLVDRYYDNSDEFGVAWDDPDLAIPWPVAGELLLSERDRSNPRVRDLDPATLVTWDSRSGES